MQQNGVVQGGAAAAVCRMRGGLVERCASQVFSESLSREYIAYCPLDWLTGLLSNQRDRSLTDWLADRLEDVLCSDWHRRLYDDDDDDDNDNDATATTTSASATTTTAAAAAAAAAAATTTNGT